MNDFQAQIGMLQYGTIVATCAANYEPVTCSGVNREVVGAGRMLTVTEGGRRPLTVGRPWQGMALPISG